MKEYRIKFKDTYIELSERPEIYLFTDKSCKNSEWVPFDKHKLSECHRWIMEEGMNEQNYNLFHHENIRFKLKNPEDIDIFFAWTSEHNEARFKTNYVKDIEYYEVDNNISDKIVTFLNSSLLSIDDDYVKIAADYYKYN